MQTTEAGIFYAGADLHGNNVSLALIDGGGKEVYRRRVKANLEAVNEALDPYWPRIEALGVESTFNWCWLVDGLPEQGRDVRLGNPAKMTPYAGIKNTDDHTDARWLAEQLRLDVFPASYIYPKAIRGVRDALRRRQLFVRQRVQTMLSLEGLLVRYGIEAPGNYALKRWTPQEVEATGLEPFVQLQLRNLLAAMPDSERRVKEVEEAVKKFIRPVAAYRRIQQVPGIGGVLGMTIVLESGDFARFANAGCYASYCRTVRSERTSNGKKKGENNRRNGNPHLAWAFIEAATFAPRFEPQMQSWYDRKKRQRNSIVARKALACKLSKAVWHVMNGKDFDMRMLFGRPDAAGIRKRVWQNQWTDWNRRHPLCDISRRSVLSSASKGLESPRGENRGDGMGGAQAQTVFWSRCGGMCPDPFMSGAPISAKSPLMPHQSGKNGDIYSINQDRPSGIRIAAQTQMPGRRPARLREPPPRRLGHRSPR